MLSVLASSGSTEVEVRDYLNPKLRPASLETLRLKFKLTNDETLLSGNSPPVHLLLVLLVLVFFFLFSLFLFLFFFLLIPCLISYLFHSLVWWCRTVEGYFGKLYLTTNHLCFETIGIEELKSVNLMKLSTLKEDFLCGVDGAITVMDSLTSKVYLLHFPSFLLNFFSLLFTLLCSLLSVLSLPSPHLLPTPSHLPTEYHALGFRSS
jgi:small-conductance mechanosensitive channel